MINGKIRSVPLNILSSVFNTMVAYGVYITTKVPDECYDFDYDFHVKGQGHIYLNSVYTS